MKNKQINKQDNRTALSKKAPYTHPLQNQVRFKIFRVKKYNIQYIAVLASLGVFSLLVQCQEKLDSLACFILYFFNHHYPWQSISAGVLMRTVSPICVIYSMWDLLVKGEEGSQHPSLPCISVARPKRKQEQPLWCPTDEGSGKRAQGPVCGWVLCRWRQGMHRTLSAQQGAGRNLFARDAVDAKRTLSWPGSVFKRSIPPKELSGWVLQGNLKAQTKAHCFRRAAVYCILVLSKGVGSPQDCAQVL